MSDTGYRGVTRWNPDRRDCDACGAAVRRRWRRGETFVCAACVEWAERCV